MDHGQVRAVRILRTQRTPVSQHRVIRLSLAGGQVLEVSGSHPTADGRRFETLRVGDRLDGIQVEAVRTVAYPHEATYDILPDSDTGTYFASGVLIGSTLSPAAVLVPAPTAPASY